MASNPRYKFLKIALWRAFTKPKSAASTYLARKDKHFLVPRLLEDLDSVRVSVTLDLVFSRIGNERRPGPNRLFNRDR